MYKLGVKKTRWDFRLISSVVLSAFLVMQGLFVAFPSLVSAASVIEITNVADLRSAIENQSDGDTWNIQPGNYGLSPFNSYTAEGRTGWYFPITANDLTINGVGNPTIFGTSFSANGNRQTQNFVSVFGDNVTINGLTLMPKVEPNKTIEVLGEDFTLTNATFAPNTLTDPSEYTTAWTDADKWGGSLYFNHEGNHTIENVTIKNGGISYRDSPTGTNISFSNVTLDYETSIDWINSYRFSSEFNNAGNSTSGEINVLYHVNSSLNNLSSVSSALQDGDTVEIDSDLTTSSQWTISSAVNVNGNGHTLDADFIKTNNSNNSAIGIQSDNVLLENLSLTSSGDLPWPNQLHGINVYNSAGVKVSDVNLNNFEGSGMNINGSEVDAENISTSNNGWHGINVDNGGVLNISGLSAHAENSPNPISNFIDGVSVSDIFIDDATDGVTTVNDVEDQYITGTVPFRGGTARVYTLVDNIDPTTDIEVLGFEDVSNRRTNKNFVVSGTAKDNEGLNRVYVQLVSRSQNIRCGGITINLLPHGTSYNWSVSYNLDTLTKTGSTTTKCLEGDYAAHATVVDKLGNTSSTGWTDDFTVDKTGPSISEKYPAEDDIISGTITARVKVTDVSDVNESTVYVRFRDDNGGEKTYYLDREGSTDYFSKVIDTADFTPNGTSSGPNRVSFRAADNLGNPRSSVSDGVIVDNENPEVLISNVTVFAGELNFELIATDANSGLQIVAANIYDETNTTKLIELGSGSPTRLNVPHSGLPVGTASFAPVIGAVDVSGLTDGTYTIRAYAKDYAGNERRFTLEQFEVDNTAPTAVYSTITTEDMTPTVLGSVDDVDAEIEVTVEGSNPVTATNNAGNWTYSVAVPLGVGTYDVTVTSTDLFGNSQSQVFTDGLVIEATSVLGTSTTSGSGNNSNQVPVKNVAIGGSSESNVVASSAGSGGTGGEPFVAQTQQSGGTGTAEEDVDTSENSEEGAEVLQSTTESSDDAGQEQTDENSEDGCFKLFGICWYWYVVPVIILILGYGYYISQQEEQK